LVFSQRLLKADDLSEKSSEFKKLALLYSMTSVAKTQRKDFKSDLYTEVLSPALQDSVGLQAAWESF
jgi:hypothetical protein